LRADNNNYFRHYLKMDFGLGALVFELCT